jgi:hypothetical protein
MLSPVLVIAGLIVLWVLIVIICMDFGPALAGFLGNKMPAL